MTNEEIMTFIQKIQRDYPKFDLTGDEYQTWHDVLSKTTKEIAEGQYESHKQGEYKNKIPSLQIFIYKPKEDKDIKQFLLKCSDCGKILRYDAMSKHESRHKSVDYIKSRTKKYFNSEITKQKELQLVQMNDIEFDKKYDEFLEKLIPVTSGLEQRNLLNIKYTRENPGSKLNMNQTELKGVINGE